MAYTQKQLREGPVFVIEKYIKDVKQDEKSVPDLLESIMKGFGLAKEELQRIVFKMNQFRLQITEIRACSVEMSGNILDSSNTSPPAPLFAIMWPD